MRNRGAERSDFLTVTQLLRSPSAYILKGAKQAKPAFKKLLEGLESRMSTHSEGKFRKFFFKIKVTSNSWRPLHCPFCGERGGYFHIHYLFKYSSDACVVPHPGIRQGARSSPSSQKDLNAEMSTDSVQLLSLLLSCVALASCLTSLCLWFLICRIRLLQRTWLEKIMLINALSTDSGP